MTGFLETDRLLIRSFTPGDGPDLYEYLSDPAVVFFEPYPVFNETQSRQEAVNRSKQDFFLAVCLKGSQKLIGNIYFEQIEPRAFATWELGYVFNSKYQGRGYATESCRAVLDQAFKSGSARRVIALCNTLNTASWRLLERLRFRREGHYLKKSFFKMDVKGNPIWQDVYEYAILSEEWQSP